MISAMMVFAQQMFHVMNAREIVMLILTVQEI